MSLFIGTYATYKISLKFWINKLIKDQRVNKKILSLSKAKNCIERMNLKRIKRMRKVKFFFKMRKYMKKIWFVLWLDMMSRTLKVHQKTGVSFYREWERRGELSESLINFQSISRWLINISYFLFPISILN